MTNQEKTYDQLINEIKNELNQLNGNDISMEQAVKLFEEGLEKINIAKSKLEEYKGKINKVLADNSIEEFA